MTTRMTRTKRPLPAAVVARRVVGTPGEVAAVVATLRDTNRLVGMTMPAQMPGTDPRVWVTVRYIDRPRAARTATPVRTGRRWPVVTAAAVAVAGYLTVQLVQAVIALLPLLVGGLLLLAVLALLLRRSGVCCPGLHCPGCKH